MPLLSGSPTPYQLEDDIRSGFQRAVDNNQINLAMYYLVEIVAELEDRLEELNEELSKVSKATAKKKTAKKAKKTEEED